MDGPSFVQQRVGKILQEGFLIGGRQFEFLAYSSSSLRDHAVWFMTPFSTSSGRVTADLIRENLGIFKKTIRCPAQLGARMSQAFSATQPSVPVNAKEVVLIKEIERKGSVFTDGKSSRV